MPKVPSSTGVFKVYAHAPGYNTVTGSTNDEACANYYFGNGFNDPLTGYFYYVAEPGACTIAQFGNTYVYTYIINETPMVCPDHAQDTGSLCRCDDGFEPDATGKACMASPPAPGPGGSPGGGSPGGSSPGNPGAPGGPGGPDGGGGGAGGGGAGGGGNGSPPPERPEKQQCEDTGNPIFPSTGAKQQFETDYTGSGRHALSFVRNFNSARFTGVSARALAATGLGMAWSHNYAMAVRLNGNTAQVEQEDGSVVWFTVQGTGLLARWVPSSGVDSLTWTPESLTYRRSSDDSVWVFKGTRLSSITQRNGWVTTLSYTGAQLTQVTNHFGQSLRFTYRANGELASVTTPDGQVIAYGSDAQGRSSTVTYPDGTRKSYVYEDSRWPQALTGIVDERGIRFASFAYDALGRGISTEHAGGTYRYSVSYGTGLATITNPLGAQYQHSYTVQAGAAALSGMSVARFTGDVAARTQNPDGTIASEADFLGITTLFTWDSARRLPLSTTRAAGRPEAQTVNIQWHPALRVPMLVTEAGRTTAYTYDAKGNALSRTVTDTGTGQARTWAWAYDAQSQATSMTDPRGGVWQYDYDASGNLASSKDPLGNSTRYAYDAANRVIGETAPNGLLTAYAYDARGRLTQTVRGGEASSYSYTPFGQLAGAAFPGGYEVTYAYDAAQRLVAAQDNRGNTVQYTLDAAGNRIREEVRDASGAIASVTSRVMSSLSRVTAVQGAAGQTTQLAHDPNGEVIASTDPLNQTTRRTLDALGRDTATSFADGASAAQAWSQLDQLTQVTDPKGVRTQYARNAFGEVMAETSPDIGTIRYTRNAAGEVTAIEDARGQITAITRDALGRPMEIRYAADHVSTFAYDAVGAVTRIEDKSGSTVYERDAQSRVTTKTQAVNDNPSNPSQFRTAYTYANGDLAGITYPSGLNVIYRRTAGRITGIDVQQPGGTARKPKPVTSFVSNLSHTALGQPRAWTWSNGDTAARTFDADGRMVSSEFASYIYDAASRITGITQSLYAQGTGTVFTTPLNFTAGYDARNRLTSFTRDGSETRYTYDANSNRLTALDKVTSDTDLDGEFDDADFARATSQSLVIDESSNKLLGFTQTVVKTNAGKTRSTVVTPVTYSLDANGAMTSDGLRSFEYDASNRLAKVRLTNNGEAASVSYLHNALGQRVFKTEYEAEQTLPNQDELGADFITWLKKRFGWLFTKAQNNASIGTAYVYGDGEIPGYALLGEYGNGSATGAGRTEYIWLPTEGGQANLLGLYRNGKFYAIHSDHLGTPRLMTDEAKAVVWQWPYSAFGNNKPTGVLKATARPRQAMTNQPVLLKATAAVEMNVRMPGQYSDVETGQFQNFIRQYDPKTGQYPQADPSGLIGGSNRYSYVAGNPLNYTDPMGLWANVAISVGVRAIAGRAASTAISTTARNLLGPAVGGTAACLLVGVCTFSEETKTPNSGEPGSWHTNPGSGQERLYGPDGRPEVDIDWDHNHNDANGAPVGSPHGHNWDWSQQPPRSFPVPVSPWPPGKTCPAK